MREDVKWFAEQMESKLQENDHKGGWEECDPFWLLDRLKEEIFELKLSMARQENEDVIKECADVANFAMMIADKARKQQL